MMQTYSSARELFEAAREAARQRERDRANLEALDTRRRGGSAPQTGGGSRGVRSDVNGTAASDAYLEYEARAMQRRRDSEGLLAYASALLYGRDGRGGVAALLGSLFADVVFWRYLDDLTWGEVALRARVSQSTAKRHCTTALDTIDARGFGLVVSGEGDAED